MKSIFTMLIFLSILRGPLFAQDSTETEAPRDTKDGKDQKGMEYIWRSSDLEGEQAVLRQQRRVKRIDGSGALPEGSERVGSVCMDYTEQGGIGRGTCTGHNGVRFWLYLQPDGDTARIATLRHDDHPDTLSDSQMLRLAAYQRYERLMTKKQLDLYQTMQEHPEWLEGFAPNGGNPTMMAPPQYSFIQDTLKMMMPTMPQQGNPTQAAVLYGVSVLIGSGMLYIINKLRNLPDTNPTTSVEPIEPDIPKLLPPDELI
jgi:hypothetical protein